ncbi:coth protein-domain-containing protein [Neocallimastix lanati (nom. inval.)]|nr:coth protein-domain-containing protein [Neocallimastix sp. JGI-2020a]
MKKNILLNLLSIALVSAKAVTDDVKPELPVFSLKSGFYKEESVKLRIKTVDSNAIIYYTTDGSIPNENSTIYKKPITLKNKSLEENVLSAYKHVDPYEDFVPHEKIKKANVIRAIAKYPNKNNTVSEVVSKTYWVGMNRKKLYGDLPLISIMTDPDNLFDYEKGIYVMGKDYDDWVRENPSNADVDFFRKVGNYNRKGKSSEIPAFIEYFPGDKKREGFTDNVGIRIMGAVSRTFIQKSFRVTYRDEYGRKNLKYDLIPGNMRSDGKGPLEKYKTFNIRGGGNDFRFTIYRDLIMQSMIRDRDIESQDMDLTIFYLDGEFWGLYIITEDYSDHYIENNYDIEKDNVIIIKKEKVEAGVDSDMDLFKKTMNYIYSANMTNPEDYAEVSKQFDINSFAWYSAFHLYIENTDGIFHGNNWAMWRAREPVPDVLHGDGIWRLLLFDTESSAGYYGSEEYNKTNVLNNVFDSNSSLKYNIGTKLLTTFMKNPEFKNLFINAICDMRNINFALDKVISLLEKVDGRVRRVMTDHFKRFGYEEYIEEGPGNHYVNSYNNLKNWFKGRHGIFMDHLAKLYYLW